MLRKGKKITAQVTSPLMEISHKALRISIEVKSFAVVSAS
jgi:hypothetical protein